MFKWFLSSLNPSYVHRNLEYVCKEGGKCIVDVSRRNQCQACRFAKCIKSNMRREGKCFSQSLSLLHTHIYIWIYSPKYTFDVIVVKSLGLSDFERYKIDYFRYSRNAHILIWPVIMIKRVA